MLDALLDVLWDASSAGKVDIVKQSKALRYPSQGRNARLRTSEHLVEINADRQGDLNHMTTRLPQKRTPINQDVWTVR